MNGTEKKNYKSERSANAPISKRIQNFIRKTKPRSKLELYLWIFILLCCYIIYHLGYKIKFHVDYNKQEVTMILQHYRRKENFINGNTKGLASFDKKMIKFNETYDDEQDGFSACLLLLDDHEMLTEWLAYHYTALPLRRVIIGLDEKNSPESRRRHYNIASYWNKKTDLNITIWEMNKIANYSDCRGVNKILCDRYHRKRLFAKYKPNYFFSVNQRDLNLRCLREHKLYYDHVQKKKKKPVEKKDRPSHWVLCTDTDEYVTYNYIKPNHENASRYEYREKRQAKSIPEINAEREVVAPLRPLYPSFQNQTIAFFMQYIKHHRKDVGYYYFPKCLHTVGLFFFNYTKNPPEQDKTKRIYLTQEYRHHQKIVTGKFSKVMLDVSRLKYEHFWKSNWDTVHNPTRGGCGPNYPISAGIDYLSSVFRLNHYLGPLDFFLKRSGDKREKGNVVKRYMQKLDTYRPYDYKNADDSMLYWFDRFVSDVGGWATADRLLNKVLKANDLDLKKLKRNYKKT